MDSKKILAKYLKPSGAVAIIGWILVIASVAMLVMGIISAGNTNSEAGEPAQFDSLNSENGEYVYLDVVGISDWAYKTDGNIYYVALDKWNYVYIVKLSNSQFNKMDDQNEYFMEEDVAMPRAYTLTGVAKDLTRVVRNSVAECLDIASYESEDYFGVMYLDATTTPGDDALALWLVGFVLCLIFGLVFLLTGLPASVNFKKCVADLEERNLLDIAAAELQSDECVMVGKDCARLSRQFFFGKNSGMVLPYSDIQWIYRRNVKRYFVTVNVSLVVSTLKLNQKIMLNYNGKNRDEELNKVFMAVAQHNPNVLLGYTSENQKAYKERRKATKIG